MWLLEISQFQDGKDLRILQISAQNTFRNSENLQKSPHKIYKVMVYKNCQGELSTCLPQASQLQPENEPWTEARRYSCRNHGGEGNHIFKNISLANIIKTQYLVFLNYKIADKGDTGFSNLTTMSSVVLRIYQFSHPELLEHNKRTVSGGFTWYL